MNETTNIHTAALDALALLANAVAEVEAGLDRVETDIADMQHRLDRLVLQRIAGAFVHPAPRWLN